MRRSRWLILAVIIGIVAFIGVTYAKRKAARPPDVPPPPPLETGLDGRANDWVYTQSDGDRPRVTVRAKSFKQIKAPSVMELDGVELQIFHGDGGSYDLVKSAKAQFDISGKTLYSDGEVEIRMGLKEGATPVGHVITIHSSGVHFASDTGKASTERAATFEFDRGGGSAIGAEYDPGTRELHLLKQVSLDWRSSAKGTLPMHVEAGEAYYKESESKVNLLHWSKFTRGTLHMEAGGADVTLENGEIRSTVAQSVRGVQEDPGRRVEFAAESMLMDFAHGMSIKSIRGDRNGRLVSTAKAARTTVTGNTLLLDFAAAEKESVLSSALATGNSVAEVRPVPPNGPQAPDTRTLRSEVIRLKMRPGGEEIDAVETDGPGTVDFIPNRPAQPKRFLKGDKIWIAYAPGNRIQSFRSVNASTRTDKPGQAAPLLTQSKNLVALFDPAGGELATLDQSGSFQYQEGERRAAAGEAFLDSAKDSMLLKGAARAWDASGSVAADAIDMNQKTGDFTAEGHVSSTRTPDRKGASSALLSNAETLQARAQRMNSTDRNRKVRYEGSAVVWQGANRVEADRIDIDRAREVFEAHGKVVSQFVDKAAGPPEAAKASSAATAKASGETAAKAAGNTTTKSAGESAAKSVGAAATNAAGATARKAPAAPVFTVVRAADLIYDERSRIANYLGGASLTRPGLAVAAREIRAYLAPPEAESSLEKAFAEGAVKIVSTTAKRTRTGTSGHAEYYAAEQKVLLQDSDPLLVDSVTGQTRGQQLTWWANNDRLLVNGVENRPADSLLLKK